LDAGQVLYRSYAATNRRSVKRNKNHTYWKASEFVLRNLADVYANGAAALNGDSYAQVYQPYDQQLYRDPVNREFVPLFLKFVSRAVLDKVREEMTAEQWFPAYQLQRKPGDEPAGTFHRFRPIQPPPDRYWADPFPVRHGDNYYIFVEEYLYQTRKGHIAVLTLDSDGNYSQSAVALQRPYHLSYPFVFQWQDNTYMIPETAQNRTVELYRCVAFPDRWELVQVLLQDVNAVDATLAEIDGRWWMFVNMAVPGMANNNDELYLFYAETPLGPWQPHRRNPVKSDCRSARPAGRLFSWHGDLYRPAQDCSVRYGYAITLHKIEQIDLDCYRETEISKIRPTWAPKLVGTHTLNHADGLTVIDGLRLQPKWLKW